MKRKKLKLIGCTVLVACSTMLVACISNPPTEEISSVECIPKDGDSLITIHGDGHIGIGYLDEFQVGERVNKINTSLWGDVQAIKREHKSKPKYYVEFENGDKYWVSEELLSGMPEKFYLKTESK